MSADLTGREPSLSGVPLPAHSTGFEPSLGGEHLLRLYRDHLIRQLASHETTHLRRAAIGDWLNSTGDPRTGVGLTSDGLPDVAWCEVPPGEVQLRDIPEPFPVRRFYIARYPVTWAQYRVFLDAEDGHADLRWWAGLRRRPEYQREAHTVDNHPAQEVSWFDAAAYCRWLSEKLCYDVRLPTEWEWQHAATGGDPDAIFPWGSEWDSSYANVRESLLRRPTAVGLYPHGASPVGALDMAGTVLEWCANEFGSPTRLDSSSPARRVMRGGSWFLVLNFARVHFRTGDDPYYRFNSVGFRLAADDLTPRPRPPTPPVEVLLPEPDVDEFQAGDGHPSGDLITLTEDAEEDA
jgi:hypothetical protein